MTRTYALVERGRLVRPADRDEAAQWLWERVLEHRARGRHACRMRDGDCPAPARRCCQGGPPLVKRGWRLIEIRRHVEVESFDPNANVRIRIVDYPYGRGLNGHGLQLDLERGGVRLIARIPAPVVEQLLAQAGQMRWSPTNDGWFGGDA